jgi:hypothetical protein
MPRLNSYPIRGEAVPGISARTPKAENLSPAALVRIYQSATLETI